LEQIERVDPQILEMQIENLIELHSLTENSVLHVLRSRFREDKIYTFVSSILVAVNPFRQIPIYAIEMMELYHQQYAKTSLPPHIYALSEQAYQTLLTTDISQSILISGESGAGKTESIKYILGYIAHVSRRHCVNNGMKMNSIQDKIVEANPLMEAFGNSKTSRNNNRSRRQFYIRTSHSLN
jgi:myosin heavy subunit